LIQFDITNRTAALVMSALRAETNNMEGWIDDYSLSARTVEALRAEIDYRRELMKQIDSQFPPKDD
jgi:hypothetical protein